MVYLAKKSDQRIGRPRVGASIKMKVYEIAIRYDLWGKPKEVLDRLTEWLNTRQKEIDNEYPTIDAFGRMVAFKPKLLPEPPAYSTVFRLLKELQKKPFMHNSAQKEYHYPTNNSYADAIDPSTPLACLRFYRERYGMRPAVGLVRWFCEMASARRVNFAEDPKEEDEEWDQFGDEPTVIDLTTFGDIGSYTDAEAFQVALYAEVCWLAELIESLGEPKPDLTVLETRLAWRAWEIEEGSLEWETYSRSCEELGFSTDAPLVNIPQKFWLLESDMPTFLGKRRGLVKK